MSDEPLGEPLKVNGADRWLVSISYDVGWAHGPDDPYFGTIQALPKQWRTLSDADRAADLEALPADRRERLLAPFVVMPSHYEANPEAGDGQMVCDVCGGNADEPHRPAQCEEHAEAAIGTGWHQAGLEMDLRVAAEHREEVARKDAEDARAACVEQTERYLGAVKEAQRYYAALRDAKARADELERWVRRAIPVLEALQEAAAEIDPELWALLQALAEHDAAAVESQEGKHEQR